ncbi:MAG: type II toxin-antitoxin system VapC family toxin [Proteobacteria bacterium]|nr:type II toxin-antitoxin system VapC family toxin [Pseudomonadota bacterium]
MAEAVIDASALLAFLKGEERAIQELDDVLQRALISSVNFCEVATILGGLGMPNKTIKEVVEETVSKIVFFDSSQALIAASLRDRTKPYGLSLGDRACLALGLTYKLPVYTADKIWKKLDIDIPIELIR